jgi:hypothetical protein
MDFVVRVFQEGGVFVYLLLPLWLGGLGIVLVFPLARLTGRRIPAAIAWMVPMAAMTIGLVGTMYGIQMAMEAVARASAETATVLMAMGITVANYTTLAGTWTACSLLMLTTLSWGTGMLKQPEDPGRRPDLMPGLLLAGLSTVVMAVSTGLTAGVVTGVASLGVVLGHLHAPAEDEAAATAAERVALAFLLLGTAATAFMAARTMTLIQVFEASALASAETKQALIEAGLATQPHLAGPLVVFVLVLGLAGWEDAQNPGLRDGATMGRAMAAVALAAVPLVLWMLQAVPITPPG